MSDPQCAAEEELMYQSDSSTRLFTLHTFSETKTDERRAGVKDAELLHDADTEQDESDMRIHNITITPEWV